MSASPILQGKTWDITRTDLRDGLAALLTIAWILGLWRWAS